MVKEILKNIWVINGNGYDNNCYIVVKDNTCVVIDSSSYNVAIKDFVKTKKLKLLGIVLTHAHFDHYGLANKLAEEMDVKIYVHKDEKVTFKLLKMADECGFPTTEPDWNNFVFFNSKELKFEDIEFKVMLTPGHTEGGIVLIYNIVFFTGDTLFADSIGRTDFEGGDMKQIMKSVYQIAKAMKDNDYLLCGHGRLYPQFKEVKQINPYVQHVLSKYE